MFSKTWRKILRTYHNVELGMYSYGECLRPDGIPRGTIIGNYCSIGSRVRIFRRNHPSQRLSQHPLFYNSMCGLVEKDTIILEEENPLTIGHDVWIGYGTIITPKCKNIGNGVVIGAGSVVTRDIPDFAKVAGVPARIIGWRFPEDIREAIKETAWWKRPVNELITCFDLFAQDLPLSILEERLRGFEE